MIKQKQPYNQVQQHIITLSFTMYYASIPPTGILLIMTILIRVGAIKDESVDRIFSAEELSG